MNQKVKALICVLLFAPAYFFLYAFLHEAGHALVILAYNGTIDNLVFWNINAHVSSGNVVFTVFGEALNSIAGMLLPTIIGAVAICFYKPNVKFIGYHSCYLISLIGLFGSMLVWVAIPVVSLFALLPRGDDVTKFLNVTNFHPLFVALGAILLLGAFLLLAYAKGLLTKTSFKKTQGIIESNHRNDKNKGKSKLLIMSFGLLCLSAVTFLVANYIPYAPFAIFNTSGIVENVLEEKSSEYMLVIEKTREYSFDLEVKARGFITAFLITGENGEKIFQSQDEGFTSSSIRLKFSKGIYKMVILFLMDYEAVADYFESTGFGGLNPKDIQYINEAFNRADNDYSAEISLRIQ